MRTSTSISPSLETMRTRPPSSSPSAAASSGWTRAACVRALPAMSLGALCIHELCDRSSRSPMSRNGKSGSSTARPSASSRSSSPAIGGGSRWTRPSPVTDLLTQDAGRQLIAELQAMRLGGDLGQREARPAAAQPEQIALAAGAQQRVGHPARGDPEPEAPECAQPLLGARDDPEAPADRLDDLPLLAGLARAARRSPRSTARTACGQSPGARAAGPRARGTWSPAGRSRRRGWSR